MLAPTFLEACRATQHCFGYTGHASVNSDLVRSTLSTFIRALMSAETDTAGGAEFGQGSADRVCRPARTCPSSGLATERSVEQGISCRTDVIEIVPDRDS